MLAQLGTYLVTTSAALVDMLDLGRSAIVTANKSTAPVRTARARGKLTVLRFAGVTSLIGAVWSTVGCVSVAACYRMDRQKYRKTERQKDRNIEI